jgi:hypothetical protein
MADMEKTIKLRMKSVTRPRRTRLAMKRAMAVRLR